MKIYTHETILNIYDDQYNLVETSTKNTYMLYPEKGKALYNILTKDLIKDYVGVGRKELIQNYIEKEI